VSGSSGTTVNGRSASIVVAVCVRVCVCVEAYNPQVSSDFAVATRRRQGRRPNVSAAAAAAARVAQPAAAATVTVLGEGGASKEIPVRRRLLVAIDGFCQQRKKLLAFLVTTQ